MDFEELFLVYLFTGLDFRFYQNVYNNWQIDMTMFGKLSRTFYWLPCGRCHENFQGTGLLMSHGMAR